MRNLAAKSSAEIIVFSDHDMAFVRPEWDLYLETVLLQHDLCGVPYQPKWLTVDMQSMPWLRGIPLAKYQGKPNLKFFGITRHCLEGAWPTLPSAHDPGLRQSVALARRTAAPGIGPLGP